MTLDRVVVGGGHFVERGGQLVQEFAEKAPHIAGHIVVAGGHFVDRGGQLVQSAVVTAGHAQDAFNRGLEASFYSRATPIPPDHPQRVLSPDQARYTPIASSAEEAWEAFRSSHQGEGLKELGLAAGCAASGDVNGALEHGINATVECAQGFWDQITGNVGWGTWSNDNR